MQIWYILPCFLNSLFTHVGPKQFFISWLRGVICFLRRYLHMISVYLIRKIRSRLHTKHYRRFSHGCATVSGERPNLLHICWNAAAKHVCMFVYGHRGPGETTSCSSSMNSGSRKVIQSLPLIVSNSSLEMEDRKEEKHELWDEIQRKDWRGGVEPPREQINYHL